MNSCKKMTSLMSQQHDRRLTLFEQVMLRIHLAACRGCRNYGKNLAFLRDAFSAVTESAPARNRPARMD